MPDRSTLLALGLAAALLVGCSAGDATDPARSAPAPSPVASSGQATTAPTPDASTARPPGASPTTAPSSGVASPVPFDQPWATTPLVDVATGETFTIADLAGSGRTVILETMAIWCTNCLAQQGRVYEALDSLDRDEVAYVLLDVDPNETADALREYRDRNGFTGHYAIATSDVARALAAEFGDQVLNPPAVPMLLVAPDGRVTLAAFGGHPADEVVELAQEHGA